MIPSPGSFFHDFAERVCGQREPVWQSVVINNCDRGQVPLPQVGATLDKRFIESLLCWCELEPEIGRLGHYYVPTVTRCSRRLRVASIK